jgi:hypothetical protein
MLDHSEKCPEEEDSVERLWLVIRSLKSPEGKYVRNFKLSDPYIGLQNQKVRRDQAR